MQFCCQHFFNSQSTIFIYVQVCCKVDLEGCDSIIVMFNMKMFNENETTFFGHEI